MARSENLIFYGDYSLYLVSATNRFLRSNLLRLIWLFASKSVLQHVCETCVQTFPARKKFCGLSTD